MRINYVSSSSMSVICSGINVQVVIF